MDKAFRISLAVAEAHGDEGVSGVLLQRAVAQERIGRRSARGSRSQPRVTAAILRIAGSSSESDVSR
jgi:hypothetical protein